MKYDKRVLPKDSAVVLLIFSIVIYLLAPLSIIDASALSSDENLGSITECFYNSSSQTITIKGRIDHRVLVSDKNAYVALYKTDYFTNSRIVFDDEVFLATAPVSVRFDFTVSVKTLSDRISLYKIVIVYSDGSKEMLSEPVFASSSSKPVPYKTLKKGICGAGISDEVGGNSDLITIDIVLSNLISDSGNGYFFNAAGNSFFFNRNYVDQLDRAVRSCCATGADIHFRLLTGFNGNTVNTLNVAGDSQFVFLCELFYASTGFLLSRYSAFERITGFIIGRGYDLTSFDLSYYYGLLAVSGCAINDFAPDCALIVPLPDGVNEEGVCDFKVYFSTLLDYLSSRTSLVVTPMLEIRLNPYGLDDSYFEVSDLNENDDNSFSFDSTSDTAGSEEINYDYGGEDSVYQNVSEVSNAYDDNLVPSISDFQAVTDSTYIEDSLGVDEEDASHFVESDSEIIPYPEGQDVHYKPTKNTLSSGLFSMDTLEYPLSDLSELRHMYGKTLSDRTEICWFPESGTGEAINACYAYSYFTSLGNGIASFSIGFDNCGPQLFSKLSYLYRYINTSKRLEAVDGIPEIFDVTGWNQLCPSVDFSEIPDLIVIEVSFKEQKNEPLGTASIWDFTEGTNLMGWYAGPGCVAIRSVTDSAGGGLRAGFLGNNYSEIGVMCDSPEPLLYCDSLSFDLVINGVEGALYEIKTFICSGLLHIESSTAVLSGKRSVLEIDTSSFPEDTEITSVRICVRPINTPIGDKETYGLMLYRVSINSDRYNSLQLQSRVQAARDDFKSTDKNNSNDIYSLVLVCILFTVITATIVITAVCADRKNKKV